MRMTHSFHVIAMMHYFEMFPSDSVEQPGKHYENIFEISRCILFIRTKVLNIMENSSIVHIFFYKNKL